MPTIYDLKPRFQSLLRPLANRLAALGFSPNQVTLAAALLSALTGLAVAFSPGEPWPFLLLPFVLFIRMALNALDGMLAREHDMRSALGAILNELGDVFSDLVLYAPLAAVAGVDGRALVLFLLLMVVSELAGVVALEIGAGRRYDGPLGKSDRAFAIGGISLLLGLGVAPGPWLNGVLLLSALLATATIVNRCRAALREVAH